MRLSEMDPRWIMSGGRRVGIIFKSPTDSKFYQSCFFEKMPMFYCDVCKGAALPASSRWSCSHSQMGSIAESNKDLNDKDAEVQNDWASRVQLCNPGCAWTCSPPSDVATFENISITPSIDGSAGGLWHGFITNGEIK